MFGPVLTNTQSSNTLFEYYRRGKFDAVKVITGWGLDHQWFDRDISRTLALTNNVIVRTTVGDPSNKGTNPYPIATQVIDELQHWAAIKPHLMIEIGNEPNIENTPELFIWEYRYWLRESIIAVRKAYPYATTIAPAFIVNDSLRRWVEICRDVLDMCDMVALHAYEHISFKRSGVPKTNQIQILHNLYDEILPGKKRIYTELGINDPTISPKTKLQEYREVYQALPRDQFAGVFFYHLNEKRDIHPNYAINLDSL